MLAGTSGWADLDCDLISVAVSLNQGKAGSDPQVTVTTDEKHTSHTTQTNYRMILDDIKKEK